MEAPSLLLLDLMSRNNKAAPRRALGAETTEAHLPGARRPVEGGCWAGPGDAQGGVPGLPEKSQALVVGHGTAALLEREREPLYKAGA